MSFPLVPSDQVMNAISWTVIHSFWQASLIAIFLHFFLRSQPSRNSHIRYQAAALALFGILLSSLITFIFYLSPTPGDAIIATLTTADDRVSSLAEFIGGSMDNLVHEQAHIVSLIWVTGVILFSVRLIAGLGYIQMLRSQYLPLEDPGLQKLLGRLGKSLQLRKSVYLGESRYVKSPLTFGHIKPIILFPVVWLRTCHRNRLKPFWLMNWLTSFAMTI